MKKIALHKVVFQYGNKVSPVMVFNMLLRLSSAWHTKPIQKIFLTLVTNQLH